LSSGKVQRSAAEFVYRPQDDLAWSGNQDRFVVLKRKPPGLWFYSLTQERGMLFDCAFDLAGIGNLVPGQACVALNPNARAGQVVVYAHRRLLVYSLSGYKLKLTAECEVESPVAELFCRHDYVGLVFTDGRVVYLDMQLTPRFRFEFGRPVSAAAFHNETWALLSNGRVLLCQDKFFARE
jgi:hypothetical protein